MSTGVQDHSKSIICVLSFVKRINIFGEWQRKKMVKERLYPEGL